MTPSHEIATTKPARAPVHVAAAVALCVISSCTRKPAEWSEAAIGAGADLRLNELSSSSANDIWGVSRPDIVHYDGTRWSVVASAGAEHIAAVASNDVWGVGRGGSWFHYDGKTWRVGHVDAAAEKYLDFWGIVAWPGEVWATAGVEGYFRYDGKAWSTVFPPELRGWELGRI